MNVYRCYGLDSLSSYSFCIKYNTLPVCASHGEPYLPTALKAWAKQRFFYLALRKLGDSQISVATKHAHSTLLLDINIWKKGVL